MVAANLLAVAPASSGPLPVHTNSLAPNLRATTVSGITGRLVLDTGSNQRASAYDVLSSSSPEV